MARPQRWWLAYCEATAEVRGVLRRVWRSYGCTKSLRDALSDWLAVGGRPPGLMEPVAWDYKILALCKGIHTKVGMGHSQIPNEAEPKPNWSLMLQSWRIEKNCLGGQGDSKVGEVMAWLGSSAASTHGPTSPLRNSGTGGTYPRRLPARPQQQGDERGMAPSLRAALDNRHRAMRHGGDGGAGGRPSSAQPRSQRR